MLNKQYNAAKLVDSQTFLDSKMSGVAIMSVFEHQRLTARDFVHLADFEWLIAQEFAVFTIKRQRGQWQLKVGHYIGVIILPSGVTLEILPKAVAGIQNINAASQTNASPQAAVMRTRQWVQLMLSDLTALSVANNNKPPHTKHLGQLSQHLAPLSAQALPLSQWIVTQFLQLMSNYQPTQHYQTQTRNQSTLQGKLLIREQLRRNRHQPHKFACEVSQFSQETLGNRLIKSALVLIEQLIASQQDYDWQSIWLSSALVSKLIPWRQMTALSYHERQRLDSLYLTAKRQLHLQPMSRQQGQSAHQLLDLAYWLLQVQQSSVPTGNGIGHQQSQPRLCLLINMNQAFEQWASLRVAAMFNQLNSKLNNQLGTSYQTLYQSQQVWLKDKSGQTCLTMRPDLLVYQTTIAKDSAENGDNNSTNNNDINNNANNNNPTNNNANNDAIQTGKNETFPSHCSHVIDIKWKHLSHPSDITASDAYQLTSYAQAYQAKQVWLVYPVTDDERQPIALWQPTQSNHSTPATLWLMPFNVTTGTLNHDSQYLT